MIILNNLPENHELRNLPLKQIGAKYKWKGDSEKVPWRDVEVGAPKLVDSTYNQLGNSWTAFDWWGVDGM